MDYPENIAAWSIKDLIQPGMTVCEVGVRSGQSSEMFLELGAFVYMIDPWEEYDGYIDPSYPIIPGLTVYEADYQKTLERVKRYEGLYTLIRKKSSDAIEDIPDNLDLIYIDGNHETEYVFNDVKNYWKKVKSGGYLAGDDWSMPSVMSGILKAFAEIVAEQPIETFKIQYLGRNWIVRKP